MGKNILIVQNFNPNKGNNSVISATMYALKDDDVNIEITSAVPETAIPQYGVKCYDWLVSYKDVLYNKSKVKKIVALLREMIWVCYLFIWILFYKVHIELWLPAYKKGTVKAYKRADVVVFPGGHSFTTMNGLGQVFSHCIGFYFGKILGKKTMVYAHTIGPFKGRFSNIIKWMSMYVLRRTDLITIREKDSMQYMKGCNAVLTAETVFSIPTDMSFAKQVTELTNLRKQNKMVVGLTIHHIYYKYFFTKEEYIRHMVDILDMITNRFDCNVLLIPMETNTGNYNDRHLAKEMKVKMQNPEMFTIIEGDYEPSVTASIIANCDMFIGTKTHSIVYGLKGEVPILCIAYQQKSNEFMDSYGVLENSIDLKDINKERVAKIFTRMYSHLDEIRKIQKEHNAIIRCKSLKNKELLLKLLHNE
jgi:polysaccharide pyruvyl transferase